VSCAKARPASRTSPAPAAGTGNQDYAQLIASGDRSSDSQLSPRNVMNSSFWAPSHREPPEREDLLLDEILKSVIGDDGYPGDLALSENWPGVAPEAS
jgi:hypothetical protein